MDEHDFIAEIAASIKKSFPDAKVWKSVDQLQLGIPDVLAAVPNRPMFGIECKQLRRFVPDPDAAGELMKREGMLLHHPFSGPQISFLRDLVRAKQEAYGLIRISREAAIRIDPRHIPVHGNFSAAELIEVGTVVLKSGRGWEFWQRRS